MTAHAPRSLPVPTPAPVLDEPEDDFIEPEPAEYFGEDIDGSWNLMSQSEHSTLYRGGGGVL